MVVHCEQVWREISNYVDGEVDAALRVAMEEHFQTCARCSSVLEGVRNVVSLYGDEQMLEVPAGFSGRLEKRLARDVREERKRWSGWSAWLVPVTALALVAGGVKLASSFTPPPTKYPMAQRGKDIPPDLVVLVASGTKIFHVAGCPFIHNKQTVRSITAKEAMAQGYVPCLRCMRKYLDVAAIKKAEAEGLLDADVDDEDLTLPGH
ncbi:MAG TPA: zf-HC2 domain-containing protein [Candidatus Sulfotelmatobacter sp.]